MTQEPSYLLGRPNVTVRAFVEYTQRPGEYFMVFASWCDCWTLPGGRPEGAEPVEAVLNRELKEELGVNPRTMRFLGFGQGAQYGESIKCAPPKIHLIYHATVDKEPMIQDPENTQGKYVTLREIASMVQKEDGIDDFLKRFPDALEKNR